MIGRWPEGLTFPVRIRAIAGPLEDCRRQIAAVFRSGADRVILGIPAATRAACEPIFSALAAP